MTPPSLYFPPTLLGTLPSRCKARARDEGKLPLSPRWSGAAPRSLLTWPEDSSGDQEAEDQTAGGGRLRCHIPPPPRGPPKESALQEGASFLSPRCRSARRSGHKGQRLLADTPPPEQWRCTFGSPPHVTFHHAAPQLLLPPFQHSPLALLSAPPETGDPLFPGDT